MLGSHLTSDSKKVQIQAFGRFFYLLNKDKEIKYIKNNLMNRPTNMKVYIKLEPPP
jgi:hypothetical protein